MKKHTAVLHDAYTLIFLIALAANPLAAVDSADRIVEVERSLAPSNVFEGDDGWTIEARMAHHGVPGVSVAVIWDGKIDWVKTYGVRDRKTGQPVEPETLFQAGSVSKPVAAIGALQMAQDDKLTLEDDIHGVLRSWKIPPHAFGDTPITLTQLLSHTAGLTVHGFPGYAPDELVPSAVQVLNGEAPANTGPVIVDIQPGSRYRYSGGGYTVAQQMMVDAAGASFPALMEERVLGPLGMTRSTYLNPLPSVRLKHAAAGYFPDGSPVPGKRHTYPEMAAAGLWTTAEDLAKVVLEVQAAVQGRGKVLSHAMAEKLLEPINPTYGRGFGLETHDGHAYFGHNGWDAGFCAQLVGRRDKGYGVVILINSNHPEFMDELKRAVAMTYAWEGYKTHRPQPISERMLTQLPGRYQYTAVNAVAVERRGSRLFMRYAGEDAEELLRVGEDRFLRRNRSAEIEFTERAGVPVFGFVLGDGGRQEHRRLAQDEILPREHLVAGRYKKALAGYRALQRANPEEEGVPENFLNHEGLTLVRDSNTSLGTAILRIATDLYPQSANTWDSLGYAYREQGKRKAAIRNYKKALSIDPAFASAVRALQELTNGG